MGPLGKNELWAPTDHPDFFYMRTLYAEEEVQKYLVCGNLVKNVLRNMHHVRQI